MPTCPNCPPGYDCESGNYYTGDVQVTDPYSFDDFEQIRDEQAARLATGGVVHGPPLRLPATGCVIPPRQNGAR
jgi:hypothetical protein